MKKKQKVVLKTYNSPDREGIVVCETPHAYICFIPEVSTHMYLHFSKRKDKQGRLHNIGNHAFWIELVDDSVSSNGGLIFEQSRDSSKRSELSWDIWRWRSTPIQKEVSEVPKTVRESMSSKDIAARKAAFAASRW